MRKVLLLLLAAASLAVAGAAADRARTAAAATQTVTISKTGYKPTAVSITVGDSVLFSNTDTVAHTVTFKAATGLQCGTNGVLTVQAGQSASCTFSTAGKFSFSDPTNKGKQFRGTVTVAPPFVTGFAATPKAVVFGGKLTLAGALASQQSGQSVQLVAQQCGATAPTTLATVTTTTAGAFRYQTQPLKQTAYSVKLRNSASSVVTATVLPRLQLSKVGRHRYRVKVSAADSFAGKRVSFQRYRPAVKRWRSVKGVLLKASTTGVAPTVVSTATFRSSIAARQRVRVVITQKAVGTCYAASHSNTIRS
jgi:plastocyanin